MSEPEKVVPIAGDAETGPPELTMPLDPSDAAGWLRSRLVEGAESGVPVPMTAGRWAELRDEALRRTAGTRAVS